MDKQTKPKPSSNPLATSACHGKMQNLACWLKSSCDYLAACRLSHSGLICITCHFETFLRILTSFFFPFSILIVCFKRLPPILVGKQKNNVLKYSSLSTEFQIPGKPVIAFFLQCQLHCFKEFARQTNSVCFSFVEYTS